MAIGTGAIAFLVFGLRLFTSSFSIDTERMICDGREVLSSWMASGRFGLVFTKLITGQVKYRELFAELLTFAFMIAYTLFFVWMAERYTKGDKKFRHFGWCFGPIFLTAPCFAEQYHFALQQAEISGGILLVFLSLFFVSEEVLLKRGKRYGILGVILGVWAFGSYQAMVPLWISAAAALFLLYGFSHRQEEKSLWRLAFCYVLWFILCFALFFLADRLIRVLFFGWGSSAVYLDQMVNWGNLSPGECLAEIARYVRSVLAGEGPFYTIFYLLAGVGVLIFAWRRSRTLALAAALLFASPFFLCVYLGGNSDVRTQLSHPLVLAAGTGMLLCLVCDGKKLHRGAFAAGVILIVWLGASQLFTTLRLYGTELYVFRKEKEMAEEIMELAAGEDEKEQTMVLAVIGKSRPSLPSWALEGETIGKSFFEWDYTPGRGTTDRVCGFLKALGYPVEAADEEQFLWALSYGDGMPDWDDPWSVQRANGMVIVKLSQQE